MGFETEKIEFKSKVTDNIICEIAAFANTEGGTLYIGIDDGGKVVGLEDPDGDCARIAGGVRDAVLPDLTPFVRYNITEDRVVQITVAEGIRKPYYLKSYGLKPAGVFVRQGTSVAHASSERIRDMIKNSDGDVFDERRSIEQKLTFRAASAVFARCGVEFGEEKYRALGLTDSDGSFTNTAYIISDQCAHTIKVAVFGNESNTDIKAAREFGGSVFEQLDGALEYLELCNANPAEITGLFRVERRDYPPEALREALINAVVHRDYGFSGSVIVNVNYSRMEFISLGGLAEGLSPEDLGSGVSQPRNKNLAAVFHRLSLIESYGTGIRRIYDMYLKCAAGPRIEVTPHTFKMILPNMNAPEGMLRRSTPATPQMNKITDYLKTHGSITDEGIRELLGVRSTRAYTVARAMCESGLLKTAGRGKDRVFLPPDL